MGTLVLMNPQVVINSVDLTTHVDQVSIQQKLVDLDVTTFGSTSKMHAAGLSDNMFTISFFQDYAASSVDATISPLVGGTTTVTVKPVNAATTTVNPAYTFTAVVLEWRPLDGKAGDAVKMNVSWPISGAVTRLTS